MAEAGWRSRAGWECTAQGAARGRLNALRGQAVGVQQARWPSSPGRDPDPGFWWPPPEGRARWLSEHRTSSPGKGEPSSLETFLRSGRGRCSPGPSKQATAQKWGAKTAERSAFTYRLLRTYQPRGRLSCSVSELTAHGRRFTSLPRLLPLPPRSQRSHAAPPHPLAALPKRASCLRGQEASFHLSLPFFSFKHQNVVPGLLATTVSGSEHQSEAPVPMAFDLEP